MAEEEGHPAERIYFRHRSLSDDSVNKTILKPQRGGNTYTWDFPDVKFRV